LGDRHGHSEVHKGCRKKCDPCERRAVVEHALQELGREVEEPDHRPEEQHASGVCTDTLAARQGPQGHDRLLRPQFVEDEHHQQQNGGDK
jgi:hypothetical protein